MQHKLAIQWQWCGGVGLLGCSVWEITAILFVICRDLELQYWGECCVWITTRCKSDQLWRESWLINTVSSRREVWALSFSGRLYSCNNFEPPTLHRVSNSWPQLRLLRTQQKQLQLHQFQCHPLPYCLLDVLFLSGTLDQNVCKVRLGKLCPCALTEHHAM
jgi:hypothetical protein